MDRHLPADLRLQLHAELTALRARGRAEGVSSAYLRFCSELARSHARGRSAIRGARTASADTGDAIRDNPASPRHRVAIAFDRTILCALFGELRALVADPSAGDGELARIGAACEREPALLEELAGAAATAGEAGGAVDRIAARIGVSPPALALVARTLAAPFFAEALHRRGPLPELDTRQLDSSAAVRCPACTSVPALALLDRADGQRRLYCSLCGETWIAPRLMCVSCGANNPTGLGTLQLRAHDARWIETCETCQHFIKTIDLRRLPEERAFVARAEEAASAPLDLIAEEAGYLAPAAC